MSPPVPGELYKHRYGELYEIISLTGTELTTRILFKNVKSGVLWCRPLFDWHQHYTLCEDMK